MDQWHLYMIRTRLNTLYTGITRDVDRRFTEHSTEKGKGAKYLRSKGPFDLVYQTKIGSHAKALKAEFCIKKMSKQKKEQLILNKPKGMYLLKILGL